MSKAISDPSCNTHFRINLGTLVILISNLLLATAGQAADPVGTLKFARGDISIESESGETRQALKGDFLLQNELVVTGAAGIAVIQLNDDSRMTLRPNTEFRVNLLDTDDDSSDSSSQPSAVLNLLRGGLRLVTGFIGKLNPSGYRLNTPTATIGIRGTEFNTRICISDCALEEAQLAGNDAAASIKEGLYVNVDEGRIFLENDAVGQPLDLLAGESGYVADLSSLPIKLDSVPAFQRLDKLPSPSQLDFDNIQISDDLLQAIGSAAEVAAVAAASGSVEEMAAKDEDDSSDKRDTGYSRAGFYIGVAGGKTGIEKEEPDLESDLAKLNGVSGPVDIEGLDNKGAGETRKIIVGYRFSKYLGIEAAHYDLGSVDFELNGNFTDINTFTNQTLDAIPFLVSGVGVTGNLFLPLGLFTERFTLFLKGGLLVWDGDAEFRISGQKYSRSFDGEDTIVGAGFNLNFNDTLSLRVELERLDIDPEPLGIVTAGVLVQF